MSCFNNAGYGQYGVFEAVPREKVFEQFEVNVFGPMNVIRAGSSGDAQGTERSHHQHEFRGRFLHSSNDFALFREQIRLGGIFGGAFLRATRSRDRIGR
jgi:NAD(P)-dependent dehydrogenase (short-subunit alcohol dehydrogenase family)